MKIVDVAEFYTDQGGGVKTYINEKLRAGEKYGHEIVIVAPGNEWGEEQRYDGRVIWVKGPPLPVDPRYYILWKEKAVHNILNREQPDIVEGSSPWTGGWFTARWPSNTPKTFIFHQDPVAVYPQTLLDKFISPGRVDKLFNFYWSYLRNLSQHFDATIVSGEWLANRMDSFRIKNPVPVPFGIDKSFFSPERRDPELRRKLLEELDLPESAPLLIAISRHHPEKRLGTIIKGFSEACKTQPMGLLIFGDGPLNKYVQWKTNRTRGVKLMGFTKNREELANILASCDYFVHGSAAETFGIVVAEAICSGLPVLTPKRGGAADLAHGNYSQTYRAGKPQDFADALLKLTRRKRPQLVKATHVAANKKIGTMDDHFKQLFQTYRSLIERKKSG